LNRGPNHFASFTRKNVNVSASQALTHGPRPFNAVFPLDTPFFWGSLADLCLEVVVHGGTGFTPLSYQACQITSFPAGETALKLQPTCYTSQQVNGRDVAPRLQMDRPQLGGALNLRLDSVLPNAACLLWLSHNGKSYFSLALPFDLAPAGAPGCMLFSGPILSFAAIAKPDAQDLGAATLNLGMVPQDPVLSGSVLHAGAMAHDPTANLLGFTFSRGVVALIGPTQLGISQVWAMDTVMPTGAVRLGFGTVWNLP
jgi:hypothetical protein